MRLLILFIILNSALAFKNLLCKNLSFCRRKINYIAIRQKKKIKYSLIKNRRVFAIKGNRDLNALKKEANINKSLVFLEQTNVLIDEQKYLSEIDRDVMKLIFTLLITKNNIEIQKPIRNIFLSFVIHLCFNYTFYYTKQIFCYFIHLFKH